MIVDDAGRACLGLDLGPPEAVAFDMPIDMPHSVASKMSKGTLWRIAESCFDGTIKFLFEPIVQRAQSYNR